ncbi:hypothetical protein JL475_12065 [Streptomyces sp. M2CJ-2]|uniref:hypothetical protein n=1 Tax=Streptomyces sp. M2CJ-2 TaxID=2803948 RepID=UPI001925BA9A|nr:hypothetical protein [Streptomyces sp. M2CJ-2]MBL3666713.1 hypothetical protein [Streptomyces sp. M2CJ-2]
MEKWREDAQPERSETAPASEGDHGNRFSRGAADQAAEPERRPYASARADWPYPYDTSAATRPMGGTPAADGTRRTPVQRGPEGMLRDPWQEDAPATAVLPSADDIPADHAADADDSARQTHDPHEVTIQLDAVQIGNGVLLGTPNRPGGGAVHEPSDGPVFVDESGRRVRRYRRIGLAVGLACAAYAVVIVATLLSGNSDAPWVPVPDQEQGQPAEKVETSPRPAEPDASPDADTAPDPGTEPTVSGPAPVPSPDVGLPAGGGAAAGDGTVEPAAPSPTPSTGTTPKPGTGTDASPSAPVGSPAGSGPATPTAPSDGTSTVPAPPPAGEDPGDEEPADTDNRAQAPAGRPAVAAESPAAPPAPSTDPAAPSPEHVL